MCKSCTSSFNGKFLQQCVICGHPAHEDDQCTVGQQLFYPITKQSYPKQRNCSCPRIDHYRGN